jgi:hypothetical protein
LFHEDTFIATLSAARKEKYVGWELPQISQQEISEKEKIEPRSFPFELDGLLPWWRRINELEGRLARMRLHGSH